MPIQRQHLSREDSEYDSADGMIDDDTPPQVAGNNCASGDLDLNENDLAKSMENGSRCEVKELYHVKPKDGSQEHRWVDEKPDTLENAERGKTKKMRDTFAINRFFMYDENAEEWFVAEIRVNNASVHKVLEKVLEGYPGLTQHELKSFTTPFLPFLHRWKDFLAYMEGPDLESTTAEHLRLLKSVLEPLLEESFEKLRKIEKTNHVSFDDLSLLFKPGITVIDHARDSAGIVRACTINNIPTTKAYWSIVVDVVDWDGRKCGLFSQTLAVCEYHGMRALHALNISPLSRLPNEADITKRLIERGRSFEKLRGQHFMAYTDPHEERFNERLVVDARAYYKYELSSFPRLKDLAEIGRLTWQQAMNRHQVGNPQIFDPPPPNAHKPKKEVEADLSPLTDEHCLLAMATVMCFNIEKKSWEDIELGKLHEIPWAEDAFDNLVLDQGEKDLVLALVERDQFGQGKSFEDFIGGKGQGMIMLLCGPPGTGKTLTAETVAEHLRRPLYKLGASDFGTDAGAVEKVLSKALKLCAHFGAVLLIDEADVFMEARTTDSLMRNELVSVFLRLLEYYKGIMILTTNRVRSIDSAFESRVDITVTYNSLNKNDRKQIWRNFLAKFDDKDLNIGDEDLNKIASWEFNGRQIKSAIKTSQILAAKKNEPLNAQHLDVVLRMRSKSLGMMGTEIRSSVVRLDGDERFEVI